MIQLFFEFVSEKIFVVVEGTNIKFGSTQFGAVLSDISGLKLSKEGSVKEFPDLKNREDWKEETIKRFKKKIKSFKTEEGRAKYIVKDLKKHGYKPLYKQKQGFRPEAIK